MIDSFVDVFTELSIDGWQTWGPTSGPLRIVGTPEPASLFALATGSGALIAGPRRRGASL